VKRPDKEQMTALEPAPDGLADDRLVLLKREDAHELGSFKWRGAVPVVELYRSAGAASVVTASTGNHGVATAWAAARAGLRAVVFVPVGATREKLRLLERHGAELHETGSDLDAAKDAGRLFAEERGLPFFEDGAEAAQYEGYAAIADEIVQQSDLPPAAVVVPVGNGALLGGIGSRLARLSPRTLRVGVVPKEAPAMALSWEAGHAVDTVASETFADGLAVRVAIPYAVERLRAAADRIVVVSERELAQAVASFAECGIRVEGAAAAALAGLRRLDDLEGPVVLVITGRNIDDELLRRACEHPESFAP
jgi:threonine dehydratase